MNRRIGLDQGFEADISSGVHLLLAFSGTELFALRFHLRRFSRQPLSGALISSPFIVRRIGPFLLSDAQGWKWAAKFPGASADNSFPAP